MFKFLKYAVLSFLATVTAAAENVPAPPMPTQAIGQVNFPERTPLCHAVCVVDAYNGEVLYAYNETERRQVASLQKVVTALCICDTGDLEHPVTISAEDRKMSAPTVLRTIKPGESYSRRVLLQLMLMGSYNNVAHTLARDAAGSEANFADLMNRKAAELGMANSHFANCNGLPAEQYSTARDMAIAALQAYRTPAIRECIACGVWDFHTANGASSRIQNKNKLLYKFPWVNGMKTGYTNAAGHCIITTGTHEGKAVIVVILGASTRKCLWQEAELYMRHALGI